MYWIRAYNTPEGGRSFSLETNDTKRALQLALEHVKSVTNEDIYSYELEKFINRLGWHLENKNE